MAVGVQRTRTQTFQNPVISDSASVGGLHPGNPSGTNAIIYTSTWLEAHWGKPGSVSCAGKNERNEIWTYKFDHVWVGGFAVVVIVPIPLVLPIERERVVFVLRDGQVVSGKQSKLERVGGFAGYLATPVAAGFDAFWFR